MFTSVIKSKNIAKNLIICGGLSIFLAVFAYIYEIFSYGQYSVYMRMMFIFPLIAGVFLLFKNSLNKYLLNTALAEKFNNIFNEAKEYAILLNTALAVFANGFLVKGIIEISGRSSSFDYLYIITGCLLLFGSAVFRKKKA